MHAIILNSGIGSRLGKYTQNNPKCMVKLYGEETILSYQLKLLKHAGISEVIISTGYMQEVLVEYVKSLELDMHITFVNSEDYYKTNYIVSVDKINDIEDDVIMLHGDLVFSEKVLNSLLSSATSSVVVDTTLPLPQKDFKAFIVNGKVNKIGIDYFGDDCVALQPLYYLQREEWLLWKQDIRRFCEMGRTNVYAEEAYNDDEKLQIRPLDIKGAFCSEIDNEADLLLVRKQFCS